MTPKFVLSSAAIALAVVLAHQHFANGGGSALKGRIGQ